MLLRLPLLPHILFMAIYLLCLISISFPIRSTLLYSEDEIVYIEAGLRYVTGVPPRDVNFEHPPLAKYLIGLAYSIGLNRYASSLSVLITALFAMAILRSLGVGLSMSFVVSLAFVFDMLTLSMSRLMLLDVYMTMFMVIAIYLYLRWLKHGGDIYLYSSAIFMGFAIASKLTATYVALAIVFHMLIDHDIQNKFRRLLSYLLIASTVFILSFTADAIYGGLEYLALHIIEMCSYMLYRHSFSPIIAFNGFLTFLTKLEIWRYGGEITVVPYNESVLRYVEAHGLFIKFNPLLGSFIWPIAFAVALHTVFSWRRISSAERVVVCCCLAACISLVHGNIFWYYYIATPLLYVCLGMKGSRVLSLASLGLNVAQLILVSILLPTVSKYFTLTLLLST